AAGADGGVHTTVRTGLDVDVGALGLVGVDGDGTAGGDVDAVVDAQRRGAFLAGDLAVDAGVVTAADDREAAGGAREAHGEVLGDVEVHARVGIDLRGAAVGTDDGGATAAVTGTALAGTDEAAAVAAAVDLDGGAAGHVDVGGGDGEAAVHIEGRLAVVLGGDVGATRIVEAAAHEHADAGAGAHGLDVDGGGRDVDAGLGADRGIAAVAGGDGGMGTGREAAGDGDDLAVTGDVHGAGLDGDGAVTVHVGLGGCAAREISLGRTEGEAGPRALTESISVATTVVMGGVGRSPLTVTGHIAAAAEIHVVPAEGHGAAGAGLDVQAGSAVDGGRATGSGIDERVGRGAAATVGYERTAGGGGLAQEHVTRGGEVGGGVAVHGSGGMGTPGRGLGELHTCGMTQHELGTAGGSGRGIEVGEAAAAAEVIAGGGAGATRHFDEVLAAEADVAGGGGDGHRAIGIHHGLTAALGRGTSRRGHFLATFDDERAADAAQHHAGALEVQAAVGIDGGLAGALGGDAGAARFEVTALDTDGARTGGDLEGTGGGDVDGIVGVHAGGARAEGADADILGRFAAGTDADAAPARHGDVDRLDVQRIIRIHLGLGVGVGEEAVALCRAITRFQGDVLGGGLEVLAGHDRHGGQGIQRRDAGTISAHIRGAGDMVAAQEDLMAGGHAARQGDRTLGGLEADASIHIQGGLAASRRRAGRETGGMAHLTAALHADVVGSSQGDVAGGGYQIHARLGVDAGGTRAGVD